MDRLSTRYNVHGFRSLLDFQIDLTPGVNIIVGPNGSGKTNFIEFLDFLDAVLAVGAANAVSLSGGVARVFSIENFKRATPVFECEIQGVARIPDLDSESEAELYFDFRYNIEIKFNKKESQIYISKEKVTIFKACGLDDATTISQQRVGSIQITRSNFDEFIQPEVSIGKRIFVNNERNPFSYKRKMHQKRSIQDIFDRNDMQSLAVDQSILSKRMVIPALDAIRHAITRGRSYNIIPERARVADHISRYGGIERDGSGLSSVLYQLRKMKLNPTQRRSYLFGSVPSDGFDMIVYWTSLIFPELEDVSITQDFHSGKYVVNLVVDQAKSLKIPMQAASDGTVKWLALVSLIITGGGMGCLEEPENFLHPKMQVFLLSLLRENSGSQKKPEFFIISTHSETLINSCRPEELVVFNFSEKGTVCGRIKNPEKVQQEINETGFGLGYYYAANALR